MEQQLLSVQLNARFNSVKSWKGLKYMKMCENGGKSGTTSLCNKRSEEAIDWNWELPPKKKLHSHIISRSERGISLQPVFPNGREMGTKERGLLV